jgi:hypothetical protein
MFLYTWFEGIDKLPSFNAESILKENSGIIVFQFVESTLKFGIINPPAIKYSR